MIDLAAQWDVQADRLERKKKDINRSACHDGKRQLLVGMAAAYRTCAEQLRMRDATPIKADDNG
jgi:hypothetical protein